MKTKEKYRFWISWTLHHAWVIPVSYTASLIVVLVFAGLFGIRINESGTPLQQLVMQVAGSSVLALGTARLQQFLLKPLFRVTWMWTWLAIIGFVLAECIAAILCRQYNLDRMELRFIERNALPEALVFAIAGFLIGIIQWPVLKKHFSGAGAWIAGSTIAWGACIAVMDVDKLFPGIAESPMSLPAVILMFAFGSALYGAITGVVMAWTLKVKT